jgi:hypothetical protein
MKSKSLQVGDSQGENLQFSAREGLRLSLWIEGRDGLAEGG